MLRYTAILALFSFCLPVGAQESEDPPEFVQIIGDFQEITCLDSSLIGLDIAAELARGIELIDALSDENARGTLGRAMTALSCMNDLDIDRDTLINLFYFQGMASFNAGDREGALNNFRRALIIDPTLPWDTDYPPDPQQAFLIAKGEVMALPLIELNYDLIDDDVLYFSLDGTARNPGVSGTIPIRPGIHVIQYATTQGVFTRVVNVCGDKLLVQVYREPDPPVTNGNGDKPSPGGLSLGVIGFAQAHGAQYLNFGLRGHVRLVKGLELDLGGGANMVRFESDLGGWLMLMPHARVGARYRFGDKKAQPYVGGAFLISFGAEMTAPGGVLIGGIDLMLTDKFGLNLEATVGGDRRGFWAGVQFGPTFRF